MFGNIPVDINSRTGLTRLRFNISLGRGPFMDVPLRGCSLSYIVFKKLFKTAETLKTESGRQEGYRRVQVMRDYLAMLRMDILPHSSEDQNV